MHIGCVPWTAGLERMYGGSHLGAEMVNAATNGERISITGRIFDGVQTPVKDGIIEIWHADSQGLFCSPSESRGQADPNFSGWGRQATDHDDGSFTFETIKPGQVPFGKTDSLQAPHISIWIAARGINLGLHTRMYFADEQEANAQDPILHNLEHKNRIQTLMAVPLASGQYQFDIHLQGDQETIFFDV